MPLEAPLAVTDPADVATRLFPPLPLTAEQTVALQQGKRLTLPGVPDAETVAAIAPDGRLVGLARVQGGVVSVVLNLPPGAAA